MNIVRIPVYGRGGVIAIAIIDAEDLELVQQYRWGINNRGYAKTQACIDGRRGTLLHRLVMPGNKMLDHKNRNKLDCRKKNLRPATYSQNIRNVKTTSSTGYRGVYTHPCFGMKNPWRAQIRANHRYSHLGMYPTPEDAARAYDRAVWSLKPEDRAFAVLNYPSEKHVTNLGLRNKLYGATEARRKPSKAPRRPGKPLSGVLTRAA